MKCYIAYCEGSYGGSGWIAFAGTDLEKVKQKIILDREQHVDEIQIYDGDTMEHDGYVTVKYTENGFVFKSIFYQKVKEN